GKHAIPSARPGTRWPSDIASPKRSTTVYVNPARRSSSRFGSRSMPPSACGPAEAGVFAGSVCPRRFKSNDSGAAARSTAPPARSTERRSIFMMNVPCIFPPDAGRVQEPSEEREAEDAEVGVGESAPLTPRASEPRFRSAEGLPLRRGKENEMDFEVAPLPYAKNALEPVMKQETLEYHYEKHHKGYMTKLKSLLEG